MDNKQQRRDKSVNKPQSRSGLWGTATGREVYTLRDEAGEAKGGKQNGQTPDLPRPLEEQFWRQATLQDRQEGRGCRDFRLPVSVDGGEWVALRGVCPRQTRGHLLPSLLPASGQEAP